LGHGALGVAWGQFAARTACGKKATQAQTTKATLLAVRTVFILGIYTDATPGPNPLTRPELDGVYGRRKTSGKFHP